MTCRGGRDLDLVSPVPGLPCSTVRTPEDPSTSVGIGGIGATPDSHVWRPVSPWEAAGAALSGRVQTQLRLHASKRRSTNAMHETSLSHGASRTNAIQTQKSPNAIQSQSNRRHKHPPNAVQSQRFGAEWASKSGESDYLGPKPRPPDFWFALAFWGSVFASKKGSFSRQLTPASKRSPNAA